MTTIIGISGFPGSGKTALRLALAGRTGCDYLDYDQYQRITDRPLGEMVRWMRDGGDYDELVIPLLAEHLRDLKAGKPVTEHQSGRQVQPGEFLFFETPLGRQHIATGSLIDTLIWLDVPLDIALARNTGALLRAFLRQAGPAPAADDFRWFSDYLENYLGPVREMLVEQQHRVAGSADIIVDGTRQPGTVLDEVLRHMGQAPGNLTPGSGTDRYLCVDRYLYHFQLAMALHDALVHGLIDMLYESPRQISALARAVQADDDGLRIQLELLRMNGVVSLEGDQVSLQEAFRQALDFRDLLQSKLDTAAIIAPDMLEHFHSFIHDMAGFMNRARVFELFSYRHCYEIKDDNLQTTQKWVSYTTMLTRYETPVFLDGFDISGYRSLLDIGGNSGEFARQLACANNSLTATVLDLPVVCELGRRHVRGLPGAQRVRFIPVDVMTDEITGTYDLVSFKSMLHDWPAAEVESLLSKAAAVLAACGTLVIYERAMPDSPAHLAGYGNLPLFLFMRHYRNPRIYTAILQSLGFNNIEVKFVQLETPFMLVSASRNT